MAIQTNNLRRLLHTVEALSELGPTLTAEREFSETSRLVLSSVMEAAGAREGALFLFTDKPAHEGTGLDLSISDHRETRL